MDILLWLGVGLLAIVLLVAIFLLVLYLVGKKNPDKVAPLIKPFMPMIQRLMKTKKGQEVSTKVIAKQVAANPDQITDLIGEEYGRDASRVIDKHLSGRSDSEREELISDLMKKASSGEAINPSDLAKRKTPEQMRAASKKKAAARAKRKQAKKHRKKR